MQALTMLSPETLADIGITPNAEVHLIRDADKLGIELLGPEHDDVDPTDFVEVGHE